MFFDSDVASWLLLRLFFCFGFARAVVFAAHLAGAFAGVDTENRVKRAESDNGNDDQYGGYDVCDHLPSSLQSVPGEYSQGDTGDHSDSPITRPYVVLHMFFFMYYLLIVQYSMLIDRLDRY